MKSTESAVFPHSIFVCPICKRSLCREIRGYTCAHCLREFPIGQSGVIDFFPEDLLPQDSDWTARLAEMEDWYLELMAAGARAVNCFRNDYDPLAENLAALSGVVLDVGGGLGITRSYLDSRAQYLNLEPSERWLHVDLGMLAEKFGISPVGNSMVRAAGEYLPIAEASVDNVLFLWVLNHASCPTRLIQEATRVLKPGGKLFAVLEDSIPKWRDLFDRKFPLELFFKHYLDLEPFSSQVQGRLNVCLRKLRGGPWPLQSDHIRVPERLIRRAAGDGFRLSSRRWIKHYLAIELTKETVGSAPS